MTVCGPNKMSNKSYPKDWARVTLMVSPTGEMHAVDGDRDPGDPQCDLAYTGFERIKARCKEREKINTHTRLFDLVRQMRTTLHAENLITDEEYEWLSGGAPLATAKTGGSPSPRRLEDYDDLRARIAALDGLLLAQVNQTKLARADRDRESAYVKKMDGLLEEIGVAVSCINPYEDLRRALLQLKEDKEILDYLEHRPVSLEDFSRAAIKKLRDAP